MPKFFKLAGIGCGALFALGIITVMVIGSVAPSTAIYVGRDVPAKYVTTLQDLGVLEQDETVRYLYSDGLFGIEEGV